MHRRDMLWLLAAGSSLTVGRRVRGDSTTPNKTSGIGLVIYTLALQRKAMRAGPLKEDLFEPFVYLDYCHRLSAAGIQLPLGIHDADYSQKLRRQAQQHGMYLESIITMPSNDADLARFEAEVRTAHQAGALALRTTIFPGRRYEQFDTLKQYRAAAEQGRQSLLRVAPILERHRVHLAIENHKDQRVDERVALLRSVASEYVGACVDLGNSFTLLEDPVSTVEALAPWAYSVHIKDQAVRAYDDGFLFADVPLGEGFLDVKKMVGILRHAKPDVRLSLETLTRDPLKVPVLTEKYWATLPEVPGRDLARTLRIVHTHQAPSLPQISRLPLAEQVTCESAGIAKSFQYAREVLGL